MFRTAAALLLFAVSAGSASAQFRPNPAYGPFFGPAFGLGISPGGGGAFGGPWAGPWVGPWYGPGLWGGYGFFPGRVGSFWSNGLTLYGPPVPTRGPVVGSFGGSDAHLAGNPATLWFPGSGPNYYGASKDLPIMVPPPGWNGPRFATRDVRRHYDQLRQNPQPALDRAVVESRGLWIGGPPRR